MNIAKNIRILREMHDMEQQDLAEKLNISNKTISSWECGRTEPRMGMIEAMCEVFGCKKTDIIDGVNPNATDNAEKFTTMFLQLSQEQQEDVIGYMEYISTKRK